MGSKVKNKQQAKTGTAAPAKRTLPMQKPGNRFAPLLRKFNPIPKTQPQQPDMAQASLQPKEPQQGLIGQATPPMEQQSPTVPFKEAAIQQPELAQPQTAVQPAPVTAPTPIQPAQSASAAQTISPAQQMQTQQNQMYQTEPGPAKSQAEIEEEKKKQMGQL